MRLNKLFIFLFLFCFSVTINTGNFTFAQNVSDLQSKIQDKSEQIKKLDAEIKVHEEAIKAVNVEAQTLQGAIKTLDINQKKVSTEIKKTQVSIDKTNLTITQLGDDIKTIEGKVDSNTEAIASSIRNISRGDDMSTAELFLGNKTIARVLDDLQTSQNFQESVKNKSIELNQYKDELQAKKDETEGKKKELVNLKGDLSDQNIVLANNKKDKSNLLVETKNKESVYKKMLADKQAQKAQFEKDLFDFEQQLKIKVDPNSIPKGRVGIISWPLDNIHITQLFGRTNDAKRLYSSGTHNGVDFGASRGTRVMSVLSGTVQATGNTDLQRGCYSYGKWVLIRHDNGLTSLYGHLDLIKVSAGQTVATGEVIGYSGATGYATGPHLHLTIYASQGVRVQQYSSSKNCRNVSIPVAQASSYLDPMIYLPQN